MKTSSAFIATILTLALVPVSSLAQAPATAAEPETPAAASEASATASTVHVSEVRIVRLSEVKGEAQLDRNTGRGFEAAFANLPIVQGAQLRTAEGVAEVEFEDNSSLRLTPNTTVAFPRLGRNPAGATLSDIQVLKGTVYVSLAGNKPKSPAEAAQFTLTFGNAADAQTLTLNPSSHIELAVGAPTSRLAVFDGSVEVQRASGPVTVGKKKELVFNPSDQSAPTLLTKIEKTPFDDWDKQQAEYHQRYASASAFGGASGYGISDLNYYGSFVDLPGCGSMWRPYFASAAFDPFANGTWAWYPGAGYSWVSPYPWAWTPFHYGSWQQCGASGWGWRPGGQWVGLRNAALRPTNLHAPGVGAQPHPPTGGHPTLIPVNARPLSVSGLTNSEAFVFNKDSAGLGVPRQGFGNLKSTSSDVARHGIAVTPVLSSPTVVPMSGRGASNGSNPGAASSARSATNVHPSGANNTVVHAQGASNTNSHPSYSNSSGSGGWSGGSRSSSPSPAAAPASAAPSHH